LELLKDGDSAVVIRTLVPHLLTESDPGLLGSGMTRLQGLAQSDGSALDIESENLTALLARAAESSDPRAGRAAQRIATLRGLSLPQATPEDGPPQSASLQRVTGFTGAVVTTTEGRFTVVFDADTAPGAVANFVRLAQEGFFDDVVWHRIVPGFVAQTGCPRGDGSGGPGYLLPDEVSTVAYGAGSVGMARDSDWDTGGSQWFISTEDTPHLVGDYTRFGTVVQGMSVVRRLERGDRIIGIEIRQKRE